VTSRTRWEASVPGKPQCKGNPFETRLALSWNWPKATCLHRVCCLCQCSQRPCYLQAMASASSPSKPMICSDICDFEDALSPRCNTVLEVLGVCMHTCLRHRENMACGMAKQHRSSQQSCDGLWLANCNGANTVIGHRFRSLHTVRKHPNYPLGSTSPQGSPQCSVDGPLQGCACAGLQGCSWRR